MNRQIWKKPRFNKLVRKLYQVQGAWLMNQDNFRGMIFGRLYPEILYKK